MKRKANILLYIETGGPGGAETVLINIARSIDRERFNPVVVLHRSGWVHEQLLKLNIDTRIIPCNRSWDLSFLVKFIRLGRQLKIDLINSHLFGAGLYACLAAIFLRVPVIATFHNELFLPGRAERYLKLKNFLIRHLARRVVLVADYMRKDYVQLGRYPEDKLLTIYNGLELDRADGENDRHRIRAELGLAEDDPVVGHVANFRPPKGHRYLIEAAAIVCEAMPEARFLLIGEQGDGRIKSEVEELIAEKKLAANVRLLGFRADVSALLTATDVFVLSSISEGHPLSVVEAMAAGRPVVATDVGGLSEIVTPGETGFLVEPKNSSAMADRIAELLRDRELRRDMGEAGRRIARDRFSLSTMMRQYQNLFEEAIGKRL
ncbi:MAG: glycosyltransferase family 4 protein [Candidatus Zixiibacteriota bacterium]|nr:MAG: glycosyltransferase family 4 protein [candidate division Zixibacteria bacterium]